MEAFNSCQNSLSCTEIERWKREAQGLEQAYHPTEELKLEDIKLWMAIHDSVDALDRMSDLLLNRLLSDN